MSVFAELNHILSGWLRWRRVRRGAAFALHGLAGGLAADLLLAWVILPSGRLLAGEFLAWCVAFALGGAALAGVAAYLWPVQRLVAARYFDRRFGLQERVSTALEFAEPGAFSSLSSLLELQQADALSVARSVRPHQALPLRLNRGELLLILLLGIGLALYWSRSQPYFTAATQARRVKQAIVQETARVAELRQKIQQDQTLTPQQKETLVTPLNEALQQLNQAQTPEQAVAALEQAQGQLNSLNPPALQQQLQNLKQSGAQLAQQAGSPLQATGQKLAGGDLPGAAQGLQQIDPAGMSLAGQEALAQQLEQAGQSLKASNSVLAAALQSASQALRQGDPAAAAQSLAQAAQALRQTGQQTTQAQQAAQAANQLGQGQQQVAQTGSQGGGSQGAGSQSGNASAGGQGASSQQGQAEGAGSGAGRGSDQTGTGSQGPQAGVQPIQTNNGPGNGGETAYEPIYAPQHLGGQGGPQVNLPGSGSPGSQPLGQSSQSTGVPGVSSVPYVDALPAYQQANQQALDSGQVPAYLRSLVRQYFSSLQP